MKIRNLILFLTLNFVIILGHGIYMIYNIFYAGYFSKTYYDWTFENGKIPSKLEILLGGFQEISVLLISSIISLIAIFLIKLKRKTKWFRL